jgi:transposase-like protein
LSSKNNVQWSAQDKAAAYVLWISNEKNVRKTARECNIPHGTFRYWVREWEENGPPSEVLDEIPAQQYEFVHHANRVRESAMNKLEELIPEAEVKQLSAIATVVGIMDDKIRLASGLATKRTENTYVLPSKTEVKELMGAFVEGIVNAAEDRVDNIIDVEVVEQPDLGLPKPKE